MQEHGTAGRYGYSGCRCDLCREANRVRCVQARAKRAERTVSGHPEGKPFSAAIYKGWHCRCEGCTAANTEACRAWREARS